MAPLLPYIPTSDVANRHHYGVTKSRKQASTGGGGRAWGEAEVSGENQGPVDIFASKGMLTFDSGDLLASGSASEVAIQTHLWPA